MTSDEREARINEIRASWAGGGRVVARVRSRSNLNETFTVRRVPVGQGADIIWCDCDDFLSQSVKLSRRSCKHTVTTIASQMLVGQVANPSRLGDVERVARLQREQVATEAQRRAADAARARSPLTEAVLRDLAEMERQRVRLAREEERRQARDRSRREVAANRVTTFRPSFDDVEDALQGRTSPATPAELYNMIADTLFIETANQPDPALVRKLATLGVLFSERELVAASDAADDLPRLQRKRKTKPAEVAEGDSDRLITLED